MLNRNNNIETPHSEEPSRWLKIARRALLWCRDHSVALKRIIGTELIMGALVWIFAGMIASAPWTHVDFTAAVIYTEIIGNAVIIGVVLLGTSGW